MKFRSIRRFFESFRNIIANLRKKPPSNEIPTEEEATPTRGKKNASPLIGEEDLEIVKSGPTLDNTMAKDRIGIKPKKNHPKQIPASTKALFEDDQSETASTTSRNLIGPEDDFSEEKKVETQEEALAVPMKYTVKQTDIAGSPKSQEKVASPIFGNGDVFANDDETKDNNDITEDASSRSNGTRNKNSSINSLASSRSSKSMELFEKEERFKKMKEQSDQKKPLPSPLKIQNSSGRADETSQSENVSDEMQSSKASLNESATSVSGSNDVEFPTTVKAISSPKFKSPIPTPRKSKTMESSLSSSDSLKSPVDGNGDHRSSSSSSSSSTKSILKSSKSSLSSRELTPKLEGRVKSSSSMNSQDGKKITRKLSNYKEELNGDDDDDDEVGSDGEDSPQKGKPKTPHLATPSDLIETKPIKSPEVPLKPEKLHFKFSESGDRGEGSSEVKVESLKSPEVEGKPDKLQSKVPPAVPTKPKFTKI